MRKEKNNCIFPIYDAQEQEKLVYNEQGQNNVYYWLETQRKLNG